jgi:hypothetical protein
MAPPILPPFTSLHCIIRWFSPHFYTLHFTSLITFLTLFLKILGLQRKLDGPIYKGIFPDIPPLLQYLREFNILLISFVVVHTQFIFGEVLEITSAYFITSSVTELLLSHFILYTTVKKYGNNLLWFTIRYRSSGVPFFCTIFACYLHQNFPCFYFISAPSSHLL